VYVIESAFADGTETPITAIKRHKTKRDIASDLLSYFRKSLYNSVAGRIGR